MRAILDENVPSAFAKSLAANGMVAERFPRAWKGLQNGRLLERLAAEKYDCLITCDKNLVYQQSVKQRGLSVLVLPATKLAQLEPIAPAVAEAFLALKVGQVAVLDIDGMLTLS